MIEKISESMPTAQAIVFSLIVITSVVAMPLAGTVAAENEYSGVTHPEHTGTESSTDSVTVWNGQTLKYTGASSGTVVTLRVDQGNNDGDFVKEYTADSSGELYIDSDGLGLSGQYSLHANTDGDSSDNNLVGTFEAVEQTFSVSTANDSTVGNGQDGDNTVDFELESNRGSGYEVYVTESSSKLSETEISEIFSSAGGSVEQDPRDDDEEKYKITVDGGNGADTLTGNFADRNVDNYTFNFNVPDSTAQDSQDISVKQGDDVDAVFGQNSYEGVAGNEVTFEVTPTSTDEFTVRFGNTQKDGYTSSATIQVEESGTPVKVSFDTYEAGGNPATPFSIHEDSEDSATITTQNNDTNLSDKLDISTYEMKASVNGETTSLANMTLTGPSVESASTYIAPSSETLTDAEDIKQSDNVSNLDTVAKQDQFVFEVKADGVYGYLNDDQTAGDLTEGSTFADETGIYAVVEETNPGPNQDPETLDLSNANLVFDEENSTFYLIFDESDYNIESNKDYTFEFYVTEDNPYIEESSGDDDKNEQSVSSPVTVVDRDAEFQNKNNGFVEVENNSASVVGAETTVAPGTEVTLFADSDNFSQLSETTVSAEQTISTELDFSNQEVGEEFVLELRELNVTPDAIIVNSTSTSTSTESPNENTTATLTVNTVDENDNGVSADVTVQDTTKTTSSDGITTFDLESGEYTISAESEEYQQNSTTIEVSSKSDNSVTLTMTERPTYNLEVDVVDENGEVYEGANVLVDGTEQQTDESGVTSFELVNGSYNIEVSAQGYSSSSSSVSVDGSDVSKTIELTPLPTYTVTVTDSDGNAVSGATVEIGNNSETTNSDGVVTITSQSGEQELTVSAEGYDTYTETVTVQDGLEASASLESSTGSETPTQDDNGGAPLALIGGVVVLLAILGAGGFILYSRKD